MKQIITLLMLSLALAGIARADQAGGLTWTAPPEWKAQGERPMRAATYSIPAAKGDPEPAELAVFYFGESSGGGVDANVKRWIDQFQKADGTSAAKDAKVEGDDRRIVGNRGGCQGHLRRGLDDGTFCAQARLPTSGCHCRGTGR